MAADYDRDLPTRQLADAQDAANALGLYAPPTAQDAANALGLYAPPTKRRAFFSFHFDDIMRVNVVRNAWRIDHPEATLMRSFYDSSLWEARQLEAADTVKQLIREGVEYTSVVCVLTGSHTWSRRWTRYEIARAVVDNRGLLTVHLNGLRHHQTQEPDPLGFNPLAAMGVGKVQENDLMPARYYLFELSTRGTQTGWFCYDDHTSPVTRPAYLPDPLAGHVMPLAVGTASFDYSADDGHRNIGAWIDRAAQHVGR